MKSLLAAGKTYLYAPIADTPGIERLPYSLRVVLENLTRQAARGMRDKAQVAAEIDNLLNRRVGSGLSLYPNRIFGQDILGQVMLVDIAALRDAVAEAGGDPATIEPKVPVDIIIDHSLQVDVFGTPDASRLNLEREYERNAERFAFLRWCQRSFKGVRVVPPGKGIMHQLNLEYIGRVVWTEETPDGALAFPDTLVGTDSHTPMINGLGILGWGVGGIEAEAVMVGKPIAFALPEVVGVAIEGQLREGVTPTDLVLAITEKLRALGVVNKFVEFFGSGLDVLSVADRGTIANMAPEYGATAVYFPIDARTVDYLRMTAREDAHIALIDAYAKAQKLWRDGGTPDPVFETVVTLDLDGIRPCVAGPRNPEDRVDLDAVAAAFPEHVRLVAERPLSDRAVPVAGAGYALQDGHVVIAAITSCTNTSNPAAMVAAGLLARNAAAKGLRSKPWVKTSLAPGSHVVAAALAKAGLQAPLDALGFNVIGFGCTTCNGGSGPLAEPVVDAIEGNGIVAAAVLSGNRNFPGRTHPNARAAYLASPALVIAYAIAGSMTIDVATEPLGQDADGKPVYLRDIWPAAAEIARVVEATYEPAVFREKYADLYEGNATWNALPDSNSARFDWRPESTYIRQPPYFQGLPVRQPAVGDIAGMRPLAILGDSVTTDHISPSGAISLGTPAADFLLGRGVEQEDFNIYTTRRGNHEVVIRASFANIRLRNRMVPGVEGGMTRLQPDGRVMRIFEAAEEYAKRGVPLVVVAGKNYGCGSSRDSAAKGVALLGVKAVIAESFERIHRTNLVGMGVLPLQFAEGTDAKTLGLDGSEIFDLRDLAAGIGVGATVQCTIRRAGGRTETVPLVARLDTEEDVEYWRNGGILPAVWRDSIAAIG
ncbi:MAG: aconitate hydratase AcnA [Alphaproteobacteria bacterium]|nr:aconitate hydratase AcnA [Alphaproteobacteria bacterium]